MFLTFDLDRVLIQNPFALGVFPEVRRRLRPYVDRSMTGGTDPDLWIMRRIVGAAEDRARAGDYVGSYDWDAIVQGVAEELGCPERLDIEAMVHSYCRLPYIAVYGDVVPALETLRERADSLWWISNGFARYQLPVVEALGLEGYFDGYFAPELHGAVKPQTELFRAAIAEAGQPPAAGVHVGDRFTDDVAGPKRAGMPARRLDRASFAGVAAPRASPRSAAARRLPGVGSLPSPAGRRRRPFRHRRGGGVRARCRDHVA